MLFNTNIVMAFKDENGRYNTRKFNIFKIDDMNEYSNLLSINIYKNKELDIRVKCPFCEEYHYYKYNINDLIKKEMVIGGCEKLGIPIFFIGEKGLVIQKVKEYTQINKKMYTII